MKRPRHVYLLRSSGGGGDTAQVFGSARRAAAEFVAFVKAQGGLPHLASRVSATVRHTGGFSWHSTTGNESASITRQEVL